MVPPSQEDSGSRHFEGTAIYYTSYLARLAMRLPKLALLLFKRHKLSRVRITLQSPTNMPALSTTCIVCMLERDFSCGRGPVSSVPGTVGSMCRALRGIWHASLIQSVRLLWDNPANHGPSRSSHILLPCTGFVCSHVFRRLKHCRTCGSILSPNPC